MRVVVLACCLWTIGGSILHAGEGRGPAVPVPRFAICPANIKEARVVKDDLKVDGHEMWRLAIILTDEGKAQLEGFSRDHVGDITELVFDGAVLIRERLMTVVDSGMILTGQWHSESAATELSKLFQDKSLDVPCGRISRLMK